MRYRGLTDANRADGVALDEFDGRRARHETGEHGRRDPAGRAAADNYNMPQGIDHILTLTISSAANARISICTRCPPENGARNPASQ